VNAGIDLIAGFIVGIGGSLHCAGMCGPLALALPAGRGDVRRYVAGRVLYNIGRTVTYVALGLIAGLAGRGIVLAGAQQAVTITIGVVLLLSLVIPRALKRLLPSFTLPERITAKVMELLSTLMRRSSVAALFLIGVLNGLLPCGFVYLGLAAAVTLGDAGRAMLFMAGFGLGTLPVMLAIAVAGKRIQEGVRRQLLRVVPVITAVLAMLLIVRGLNLGIPYISPHVDEARPAETHCH
jgi:sulfite exporter TauE/SafE